MYHLSESFADFLCQLMHKHQPATSSHESAHKLYEPCSPSPWRAVRIPRGMQCCHKSCLSDVNLHVELPQLNIIPTLGHPFTYRPSPLRVCQSLIFGWRIRTHVHGLLTIKSVKWPKFQICINVACWAPSLPATGSVKRYPLCSLEINTSSTTVTMLLHMRTQHHSHRNSTMAWLGIVLVKNQVVQCDMHVPRIRLETQHGSLLSTTNSLSRTKRC